MTPKGAGWCKNHRLARIIYRLIELWISKVDSMEGVIEIQNRHTPIEAPVTCMLRIFRDGCWYDMRPLFTSIAYSRKVISRLRRKGRKVSVRWLSGMGYEKRYG